MIYFSDVWWFLLNFSQFLKIRVNLLFRTPVDYVTYRIVSGYEYTYLLLLSTLAQHPTFRPKIPNMASSATAIVDYEASHKKRGACDECRTLLVTNTQYLRYVNNSVQVRENSSARANRMAALDVRKSRSTASTRIENQWAGQGSVEERQMSMIRVSLILEQVFQRVWE